MKRCPICKIEFSDEAEFCPKCQAKLQEIREEENAPFDRKRLVVAIVSTMGFMAVIAAIYYIIGLLNP